MRVLQARGFDTRIMNTHICWFPLFIRVHCYINMFPCITFLHSNIELMNMFICFLSTTCFSPTNVYKMNNFLQESRLKTYRSFSHMSSLVNLTISSNKNRDVIVSCCVRLLKRGELNESWRRIYNTDPNVSWVISMNLDNMDKKYKQPFHDFEKERKQSRQFNRIVEIITRIQHEDAVPVVSSAISGLEAG